MTLSPKLITAALVGALLAIGTAACSASETPAATTTTAPAAVQSTPSATPSAASVRLKVADLMAKAGCKGDVIGTQMFSYETGRCMLGSTEVTIAVFDTAAMRDEWVKAGKSFGMTAISGDGWAAGVAKPDQATALVSVLGGKVA